MSSNFCGPHAISTVLPAPVLRNGSMSSARQAAELHKGTRPPRGQRIHCSPAFPLQAFLSTQQMSDNRCHEPRLFVALADENADCAALCFPNRGRSECGDAP